MKIINDKDLLEYVRDNIVIYETEVLTYDKDAPYIIIKFHAKTAADEKLGFYGNIALVCWNEKNGFFDVDTDDISL